MEKQRRLFVGILIGLIFFISSGANALAQASAADEEQTVIKEVTGIISNVSKHGIAVETDSDDKGKTAKEMFLPFEDGRVIIQRARSIEELNRGDTVRVVYEQKFRVSDKEVKHILNKKATHVVLEKKAPIQQQRSEDALISDDYEDNYSEDLGD